MIDLYNGLKDLGVEADEIAIKRLNDYSDILREWNEKINLTTITEPDEVAIKHFIDSATCIATGYIKKNASLIDVGTGAGFPGVPIKILREDIELTLLDSLNKRILYLNDLMNRLGYSDFTTIHSRAEDGGNNKLYREKYDVAVSRAVAELNVLLEYCLPYVRVGGYFLCQKGPSYGDELENAKTTAKVLGAKLIEVKEYKLPQSDIVHYILIYEKIRQTPAKYPRKPGKPTAEPIK